MIYALHFEIYNKNGGSGYEKINKYIENFVEKMLL